MELVLFFLFLFMEYMLDLAGKIAFISGAAQGIGLISARKFISEGAKVIAVDQQKDKLDLLSLSLIHI